MKKIRLTMKTKMNKGAMKYNFFLFNIKIKLKITMRKKVRMKLKVTKKKEIRMKKRKIKLKIMIRTKRR